MKETYCKQCVILAGGLGTRLREIVYQKPKALADIHEKPFLHYQISFLAKHSIRDILLCTGYMGDKIRYYVNRERKNYDSVFTKVNIKFSNEGNKLLGTGGALKHASHMLEDRFLLLNGDTLFLTDIYELTRNHLNSCSHMTIGLTEVHDSKSYGTAILQNAKKKYSRVLGFYEKKQIERKGPRTSIVSAGLYLIEKACINWTDFPVKFSLEEELLPSMVSKHNVYGFLDRGSYFIDIGTPERYRKMQQDLANNKIVI